MKTVYNSSNSMVLFLVQSNAGAIQSHSGRFFLKVTAKAFVLFFASWFNPTQQKNNIFISLSLCQNSKENQWLINECTCIYIYEPEWRGTAAAKDHKYVY